MESCKFFRLERRTLQAVPNTFSRQSTEFAGRIYFVLYAKVCNDMGPDPFQSSAATT